MELRESDFQNQIQPKKKEEEKKEERKQLSEYFFRISTNLISKN